LKTRFLIMFLLAGFGASFTESSAWNLACLPEAKRLEKSPALISASLLLRGARRRG